MVKRVLSIVVKVLVYCIAIIALGIGILYWTVEDYCRDNTFATMRLVVSEADGAVTDSEEFDCQWGATFTAGDCNVKVMKVEHDGRLNFVVESGELMTTGGEKVTQVMLLPSEVRYFTAGTKKVEMEIIRHWYY